LSSNEENDDGIDGACGDGDVQQGPGSVLADVPRGSCKLARQTGSVQTESKLLTASLFVMAAVGMMAYTIWIRQRWPAFSRTQVDFWKDAWQSFGWGQGL
jgi:hypothetical protein